jgi:glycosyltransferase involved in cell wall biosynthesis
MKNLFLVPPTILYITHGYPLEQKDMFSGDDYSFLVKEPWQVVILPRLKPVQEAQASSEIPPVDHCLLGRRHAKMTALLHPDALRLLKREAITCMGQKAPFHFFGALKNIGNALQARNALRKCILSRGLQHTPLVAYFFWFSPAVVGAWLLRREFTHLRIVTRLHGGDLFPHQSRGGYLPFRFQRVDMADAYAPCSQRGTDFLANEGVAAKKLTCAYLGVPPVNALASATPGDEMQLLSCSFTAPVKRLPLMAQSLLAFAARHPHVALHWHHVGDGPQMAPLKATTDAAPPNLTCTFHGGMKVDESRHFFLGTKTGGLDGLINVSESEGLPVSMMEAQMAGLPVIGTDVGGVSEIVRPDTGILLPKDFTQDQFDSAVLALCDWKKTEIREHIAQKARDRFSLNNYKRFIDEVLWPQMNSSMSQLQ